MIPVLYNALETEFANNGLGGLPDAINCTVTEQRNVPGGFYLEMDYPVNGLHFSELAPERIIRVPPAPEMKLQPFRIGLISKPINGVVHIEAPHVSADALRIVTYGTFNVHSVNVAFDQYANVARSHGQNVPFHLYSDKWFEVARKISFPVPTDFGSILAGAEGSFVDVFGGELDYDGWNIGWHENRGRFRGIEIRYGVNMTNIVAETDSSELVTAVLPYWEGDVNGTETVIVGDLCTSSNASAFAYVRSEPLDVTDRFDGDTAPTKAQVTAVGQSFINSTTLKDLNTSITVQYTPTADELREGPIYLCDTVKVVHPDLEVSSTAKVVETKFNVLTERYDEITIGSIKKNIVETIAKMVRKR